MNTIPRPVHSRLLSAIVEHPNRAPAFYVKLLNVRRSTLSKELTRLVRRDVIRRDEKGQYDLAPW